MVDVDRKAPPRPPQFGPWLCMTRWLPWMIAAVLLAPRWAVGQGAPVAAPGAPVAVPRVAYRPQWVTDWQSTSRQVRVPVTERRWEAQWRGRWNPFTQPRLEYRLVERTHIETRNEVVRTPVPRVQWVATTEPSPGSATTPSTGWPPGNIGTLSTRGVESAGVPPVAGAARNAAASPLAQAGIPAGGTQLAGTSPPRGTLAVDPFAQPGASASAWPNGYIADVPRFDDPQPRRGWLRRRARTVPVPSFGPRDTGSLAAGTWAGNGPAPTGAVSTSAVSNGAASNGAASSSAMGVGIGAPYSPAPGLPPSNPPPGYWPGAMGATASTAPPPAGGSWSNPTPGTARVDSPWRPSGPSRAWR